MYRLNSSGKIFQSTTKRLIYQKRHKCMLLSSIIERRPSVDILANKMTIYQYPVQKKYTTNTICTAPTTSDVDATIIASAISKRRLKDILAARSMAVEKYAITFDVNGKVKEAITHFAINGNSACIAVDKNGEVNGLFTARDIIRFIHGKYPSSVPDGEERALSCSVRDLLTKKDRLIFCSPEDSVRHCREIMFQHKIRHVPVIEDGQILGIVTSAELSDSYFSVVNAGGKRSFMDNVMGRQGLPEGTRANLSSNRNSLVNNSTTNSNYNTANNKDNISLQSPNFGITLSSYALPHPFKKENGVGANRRDYGPGDLCSDANLSEDAHYCTFVDSSVSGSKHIPSKHAYMIVADGVGSWRQYGVDPRLFAHKLVENAKNVIEGDALQRKLINEQAEEDDELGFASNLFVSEPISPLDVIVDACAATDAEEITGSCTICVATVDSDQKQLTVSNLGDCGLMVIRHMYSETVGYMQPTSDIGSARHKRAMQIAFLSQQQLRSFNLPYQLGYSGIPEHNGTFEKPSDATTFSIPILPGDIIVMATDGLFDNIELDDIVEEVAIWEDKWFGLLFLKNRHPSDEQNCMDDLSTMLTVKAREQSLDKTKDSPFAILAKDNDILWSGGMPDDTTVVCARVWQDLE
jgi:protein phosphatase PTC7